MAATAEKFAHVVLHCITRSKTIATPVNGSLIVRPILSRQRHYSRAVHRNDKRTAFGFGVARLTHQNVTRHNSLKLAYYLKLVATNYDKTQQQQQHNFPQIFILQKVTGTFVPTYFCSQERKFHAWNFRFSLGVNIICLHT